MHDDNDQPDKIRAYYRVQAAFYDATRWSFLFGRNRLLSMLPEQPLDGTRLLEVGCGTWRNLKRLAAWHPGWQLTGVDVSPDMLARAAAATRPYAPRVELIEKPYGSFRLPAPVDLVLFSYSLTMFNPGWEQAIDRARADLRPGGHIAIVDFHRTPLALFRHWLRDNHVRIDGHLLPYLQNRFRTISVDVQPAWLGLWTYFMFVGQKEG